MSDYPSDYHARIARAMAQYMRNVSTRTTPAGREGSAGIKNITTPKDRRTPMIATPEQEVQTMQTIKGEGLEVLTRLMEAMKTEERWRTPETKVLHAFSAVRDGRVQENYPPGLWHVQGTKKRDGSVPTYTVTDSCTCEDSQTNMRSKYCYHMAAVELAQRYRHAMGSEGPPPLFPPPPTIDERLAGTAPGGPQMPKTSPALSQDLQEPEGRLGDARGPERHIGNAPMEQDALPELPSHTPSQPGEPVMSETTASIPTQDVTPEILQKQRTTIRHMLQTLGYKPTSVEEYQGIVLTLTDLILAPENFPAIIEILQQLIVAKTKPPGPTIPAEHLTKIQGVNTVKYIGLLQLARERGLQSLIEEWVENLPELALARAIAKFDDGRVFQGIGDATPENAARVKLHWRRLAGTRAKARALRDALGIEAPADEEME